MTAARVAALYDIHGNLPALEAVLDDVRRAVVDRIVIGGDVLPGPMPAATLDRLRALDVPVDCIHGNGDRVILADLGSGDISEVPPAFHEQIHWTATRVSATHQAWMAEWPSTVRMTIDGVKDVLFCHATPRNDVEVFTRVTPADRLVPVFHPTGAVVVVCGHTHMPFDRSVGDVRVVNAGSVGLPFSGPAGAYWLLLDARRGIELRRTEYDVAKAADAIRRTGFPRAEESYVRYVLNPPAEADTLKLFAPAELT